jgi:translation elongation factor EF-Tu-like GTPase
LFRMTVADVFFIRNRGLVATGTVERGALREGDEVEINGQRTARVAAIEMFRKKLGTAAEGQTVGLLMPDVGKEDVRPGDVISAGGAAGDVIGSGGAEAGDAEQVFRDAGLGGD